MCIVKDCREIYRHLADEQSKMIYRNRLNYSLTGDRAFIGDIVDHTIRRDCRWISFCEMIRKKAAKDDPVIFGAGIWGNILYQETKRFLQWKAVVDSAPQENSMEQLPVISFKEFLKLQKEEVIVISSFKHLPEMCRQLKDAGIPEERIVDAGSIIYELTEKVIYFDLFKCKPGEGKETFIDAGGFDGLTTARFMDWCGGKGYSYIFEPDERNIQSIKNHLGHISNYRIVPKALWSKTAVLAMDAKGNFATSVREKADGMQGETTDTAEAVSLDEYFEKEEITFIKMDIEGAEKRALQGAARIIAEQKPKLAVSIYHKAEDIWELPRLLLQYCPEYRFYLRHYSFSGYDTVLYAVDGEEDKR